MKLNNILSNFFGKKSDKDVKLLMPIVESIKQEYAKLANIPHDGLRAKSAELIEEVRSVFRNQEQEIASLKEKLEDEEIDIQEKEKIYTRIEKIEKEIDQLIKDKLDAVLPRAFAIVKDTARRFFENEKVVVTANQRDRDLAAKRNSIIIEGEEAIWFNQWLAGGNLIKWDMVHYDEQLIGGIVLHSGKISEMSTGEGKTLVATLPVFLNALSGRGVHIVTVNDYLSKRDSEWMGTLFEFHGLVVDCIDRHQPNSDSRRKAYLADVTFGTNNEFGFDYLRDNMSLVPEDLVQRIHNYAIVDEVDSVLIDDARTPLIISGPAPRGDNQMFEEMKPKVVKLYDAQKKLFNSLLTDAKKFIAENHNEKGSVALLRAYKALPQNKALIKFLSESGNKTLMRKTEDTYLAENAKRMPEITEELFFVIDEKNNSVELTDKGIDLITSSSEDNKFFILPDIGSEIADIEKNIINAQEKIDKKEQLLADYAIKSERVHTIHQLLKAYCLFEKDDQYVVMDNKVKIVDEQTGRILDGRRYSDGLHQAIEAKENVKIEAATQTMATITLQNYFRMYKKLAGMTGTAETEAGEFWDIYKLEVVVIPTHRKIIRDDRQDLVYKTKRAKYNAVIDEIAKLVEAGRPVLVGTTSVEISELLSRMLNMRGIRHNVLNAKLHQKEADIVADAGKSKTVTIATNMAGRGTDIKLSPEVVKAGGLAIIGTERHESRRVDRQLRGRAGRQGDPGSSQFFVSLEDDLMRLFGSDRISVWMDRLGLKEDEVIQHSMITRTIEKAQRKVEENNFGIRKRLLEYDDVMNSQRDVIYKKRKHALFGERIELDISNMIVDICDGLLTKYHGEIEYEDFKLEVIKQFAIEPPFSAKEYVQKAPLELGDQLAEVVIQSWIKHSNDTAKYIAPFISDVYKRHGANYHNITMPYTDGLKTYQINVHFEKAFKSKGKEVVKTFEKSCILSITDELWMEHLRDLDDLKQSVQNATYEQKDPLLIYKFESFNLFKGMLERQNGMVVSTLLKAKIPIQVDQDVKEAAPPKRLDTSKLRTNSTENTNTSNTAGAQIQTVVRTEKKVGRNDPCPCGSGKKFKQCHGKNE